MTEAKMLEWGTLEHSVRLDDLARVRGGLLELEDAQLAAKARSRRAGLTQAQTDRALRMARVARTKREMAR